MNRWRIAGGIVVLVLLAMLCWLLGREHREPPPPPPVPPEASPTAPPPAPPAPPPPVSAPPTVAEAPPLPRTETPEPPAAPAPGPSLAAIVVRDIADGNPVAGLAFQLTLAPASGSGAAPQVSAGGSTDALGRLEVDEKRLRSFRPKSDPWHLLGSRDSLEETIRNGAWVYRTMTILATVEVEGEDESFQLGSIKADQATVPDDLARDETALPAPLRNRSVEWLRRRSIESAFVLQPETARMLRVTCPWTGGGSIAFSHPGWLSVLAPLQGMDPAGENRVTLRFLRAPRVRGIVRDRDGKPLSGVGVRVYTTRRGNYEEGDAMAAMARHPGGGLSISRNKRLNQSRVTLSGQYMTKQDGAFELPIHQDGESLLLIWEKEFEPFHRTLGPLHGDLDVGEVVLGGPAAIAQVQALWDGKPQKAGVILLSDFRFPEAQPAISVTLDEEGRFPASLLVQGGEYAVIPQGKDVSDPRARWLEWKGEAVFDLGKLRLVSDVLTERAR